MSHSAVPTSTIRLILEYKSFPMWLCDERGIKTDEGLVEELADDIWLRDELDAIQDIYNGLFIDNKIEFRYVGFPSLDVEKQFDVRVQSAFQYIKRQIGDQYPIREG